MSDVFGLTALAEPIATPRASSAAPSGTSTLHIKIKRTPLGFQRPTGDHHRRRPPKKKLSSRVIHHCGAGRAEDGSGDAKRGGSEVLICDP